MKKKLPLIITLLVLFAFVGAYLFIPKTYPIYQQALTLTKKDLKAQELLGSNIKDELFAYSKISRGLARIEVGVSGSNGNGELHVFGHKKDNLWVLDNVYLYHSTLPKRHVIYGQ